MCELLNLVWERKVLSDVSLHVSSQGWECLLHCIESCKQEDRRVGRPSARTLWCQHDNTVKELKNSLTGILLAALVQERFYDEAGSYMLPVGHTHEDIGGLVEQRNCFWF